MKEYLISVLIVSVCIGVFGMLNESFNGSSQRSLRLVGSLCVVSVIIWPISPLLSGDGAIKDALSGIREDIKNIFQVQENDYNKEELEVMYRDNFAGLTEDAISNQLETLLCDKYLLEPQNISVTVNTVYLEDGSLQLVGAVVTLKNEAIWENPYHIEKYVTGLLGCECSVRSSN